jgi:hypothetical protein
MNYSRRIAEHLGTINVYYMDGVRHEDFPDYEESLDLMHEAEKQIKGAVATKIYINHIHALSERGEVFEYVHAPAQNRAKAFCNTLGL